MNVNNIVIDIDIFFFTLKNERIFKTAYVIIDRCNPDSANMCDIPILRNRSVVLPSRFVRSPIRSAERKPPVCSLVLFISREETLFRMEYSKSKMLLSE